MFFARRHRSIEPLNTQSGLLVPWHDNIPYFAAEGERRHHDAAKVPVPELLEVPQTKELLTKGDWPERRSRLSTVLPATARRLSPFARRF